MLSYIDAVREFPVVKAGGRFLRTNDMTFLSWKHLRDEYAQLRVVNENGRSISFLRRWLADESVPFYLQIDVFPDPSLCPPTVYNVWTPFAMESVPNAFDPDGLAVIQDFIAVLCDRDEDTMEKLYIWMQDMICRPQVKTVLKQPCLCGIEPQGWEMVEFFLELLANSMGKEKVYEYHHRRDRGDHSLDAARAIIAVFRGPLDNLGAFNAFVSDHVILAGPGTGQMMKSYHRGLIVSRNAEPPSDGERRVFHVRCGTERIGDVAYFHRLHETLQRPSALKAFWMYVKRYLTRRERRLRGVLVIAMRILAWKHRALTRFYAPTNPAGMRVLRDNMLADMPGLVR